MRRRIVRLVIGGLLILVGLLAALQTLEIIESGLVWLWAAILGVGGAAFLYIFRSFRSQWWAIIPGISLIAIALSIVLGEIFPDYENIFEAVILGGIGLSFLLVYVFNRDHWWTIIPGGVMVTLGGVSVVDSFNTTDFDTGGLFFMGLGVTFALLYLLPSSHGRMTWALLPAGILVVIGVSIGFTSLSWGSFIFPMFLIAIGVYYIIRTFRK